MGVDLARVTRRRRYVDTGRSKVFFVSHSNFFLLGEYFHTCTLEQHQPSHVSDIEVFFFAFENVCYTSCCKIVHIYYFSSPSLLPISTQFNARGHSAIYNYVNLAPAHCVRVVNYILFLFLISNESDLTCNWKNQPKAC